MFWADRVAQELKARKLPLEWVDDMKTPSGRVHVGSLRGVVIHDLVFKVLKELGVKAKYTYVFENHDPMDDIPIYLPREKFEKYLGMPLFKIPSPVKGYKDFATYYAEEFIDTFNVIGCHPEILWTKDLYTSEKMNKGIKLCLDKANVVRGIYEELYKKKLPNNWFPFQVYCPECGKVSTTKVTDWDGEQVTFECRAYAIEWTKGCGCKGKISPFSDKDEIRGKLPWKVEWAVKWQAIGVTVEGAGKDHMGRGGSHDLASKVAEQILNYPVPYPVAYEFFLVGGKKMSSSKGHGSSAAEVLEILPPEILRFLMVKTNINQAINFDPSNDTIPRLFDEYQEYANSYFDKNGDDYSRIFELSQIDKVKKPPKIRFSTLAQLIQMPNKQDEIKKEKAQAWIPFAKIWLGKYAPESERFVVQETLPQEAKQLSDKQKQYLKKISEELGKDWDAEDFQQNLYEWTKEFGISSKDAFAAIYTCLLDKTYGPKAAWLILSLDREFVKNRFKNVESAS